MLGGELLGAYCLSEPQSGSDAAALATAAVPVKGEGEADGYRIDGVKAWISHAGQADFYTLFARTSGRPEGRDRARGISCLHVPAATEGVSAAPAEHKMGMRASVTAQMIFDGPGCPRTICLARRAGLCHRAHRARLRRLGIAACATGLAQAALDLAVGYARERQPVRQADHRLRGRVVHARRHGHRGRGVPCAVSGRGPAQGRRAGVRPAGRQWPSCWPATPRCGVTIDAVQVLGGYGYVAGLPGRALHA